MTSHAAGWDSDSPTSAQLKELFDQIDHGRITRVSLQAFLRHSYFRLSVDEARAILNGRTKGSVFGPREWARHFSGDIQDAQLTKLTKVEIPWTAPELSEKEYPLFLFLGNDKVKDGDLDLEWLLRMYGKQRQHHPMFDDLEWPDHIGKNPIVHTKCGVRWYLMSTGDFGYIKEYNYQRQISLLPSVWEVASLAERVFANILSYHCNGEYLDSWRWIRTADVAGRGQHYAISIRASGLVIGVVEDSLKKGVALAVSRKLPEQKTNT